MERLQLLEKAEQLAHETIENVSALPEGQFIRLLNHFDNPEVQLAKELLEEAAADLQAILNVR